MRSRYGWNRKAGRCRNGRRAQARLAFTRIHPYRGTIGLIAPYPKIFAPAATGCVVTARGDLRLCLFGEFSHPLRDLLQNDDQIEALQARICSLLPIKKPSHYLHDGATGLTPHLALLGG